MRQWWENAAHPIPRFEEISCAKRPGQQHIEHKRINSWAHRLHEIARERVPEPLVGMEDAYAWV
jgi:hypothetical protein